MTINSNTPFDVEQLRDIVMGRNGWTKDGLEADECLYLIKEIDRLRIEVDFWKAQTDEWQKLRDRLRKQLEAADKLAEAVNKYARAHEGLPVMMRLGALSYDTKAEVEAAFSDYRLLRPAEKEKTT